MSELVLPLHLLILAATAVAVLIADHDAYLWIKGRKQTLDATRVVRLHWIVAAGLSGMVLTGIFLFLPKQTYLLGADYAFYIKMFFVFALFVNSFFIYRLLEISTTRQYSSLSSKERRPLFISGAISTISWVGAAAAALFILP